jgi:hypothetical protein
MEAHWLHPKMFHVDPAHLHQGLTTSRLIVNRYIKHLRCTKTMGSSFLEATKPRERIRSRKAGGIALLQASIVQAFLVDS